MTTSTAWRSPAGIDAPARRMTVWRLEWLRLVRSRRWIALLAVQVVLGVSGPLLARYATSLLGNAAGGQVRVIAPAAVPADGVAGYVRSALQIGLLVVVVVSSLALALDARPPLAVFYRTRLATGRALVLPRVAVSAAAAVVAYLVGLGVAWYETAALIGGPDAGRLGLGALLVAEYLLFAVSVVAVCGALWSGTVAVAGVALVALLLLPVVGTIPHVGRWLPSQLTAAPADLLRGGAISDQLPAVGITAAVTVLFLAVACRLASSRIAHFGNDRS